ncbi:hypothetical protein [Bacteroides sp. 224]|uniref:hypothetical protein n=1 Tax=Bacteroides sp. 224 TaxID=2302936 RepID=UPI0013D8BB39|nr:hypothetical protein [Bacteroides sp. 224]NDV65973.1 hypothetical protein [Bacteroides sp. 224]
MNNIFDIRRFGLVLGKDLQENWKRRSIVQFAGLFGGLVVILIMNSMEYLSDMQHSSYYSLEMLNLQLLRMAFIYLAVFGVLMASTLMEPMNSKTKRITYLTLPASNVEKFLSRWLILTVGYTLAFFVALWVADAFRVVVCSIKYPDLDVPFMDLSKLVSVGEYDHSYLFPEMILFWLCLTFCLFIQSLFILGSTFWQKSTFLKTFATGVVISGLFLFICNLTIQLFYEDYNQFGNVINSFDTIVFLQDKDGAVCLAIGILAFLALFNWTLAFFRFKESEIIKRW